MTTALINSHTTSSEQLCSCMQSDLREVTKLKVRGWVFLQKLISRRTLSPLSTTASLITSSMGDQYLFMENLLLDNAYSYSLKADLIKDACLNVKDVNLQCFDARVCTL